MNQHRTGRVTIGSRERIPPISTTASHLDALPSFLRSLETNTADSEIVRETKYPAKETDSLSSFLAS